MGSNCLLGSSLLGLPAIDEGVLDAVPLGVIGSVGNQSLLEVLLPLLGGDVDEVPSDGLLAVLGHGDGLLTLHEADKALYAAKREGRNRLLDEGLVLPTMVCDAEKLPFADNSFDLLTISFGLRNVTDKDAALAAMYRVLKPGGRLLVLEFSKPVFEPFSKLYDLYSFTALPVMGKIIANDAESYKYLAESIRMHPDQRTLKGMMENAGFQNCDYHNLTGGIVAVHRGFKL